MIGEVPAIRKLCRGTRAITFLVDSSCGDRSHHGIDGFTRFLQSVSAMSWSDTTAGKKHTPDMPVFDGSRRRFLVHGTRAGVALALCPGAVWAQTAARPIQWDDLEPVRSRVRALGLTPAGFVTYITALHQANVRRVGEGDLDHLIFYALQSTRFTQAAPIEPALSARSFVNALTPVERDAFLKDGRADGSHISVDVKTRVTAFVRALDSPGGNVRLAYFRDVVKAAAPEARQREALLLREYMRVMRFIYEKEFVAQRSTDAADAVAELYRTRGLSTDTAVEAGYLVSSGLAVLKALEPQRRIRKVLIVGPGLDLAPRTGLIEAGPPESYQPWAVIDALVALGLSRIGDLDVAAADINPRVVEHLRHSRVTPPALTLISGIAESDTVTFSSDYREYFARLGHAIGSEKAVTARSAADAGHLIKAVTIPAEVARVLRAERVDIVTERLAEAFDLIVATNILPYFDEVALTLAMGNIASMLAAGGIFIHNEGRPSMRELTAAYGMSFEQLRQAVIANVRGAPAPLVDSVWLHRKVGG
jgi:hypothetical protein